MIILVVEEGKADCTNDSLSLIILDLPIVLLMLALRSAQLYILPKFFGTIIAPTLKKRKFDSLPN